MENKTNEFDGKEILKSNVSGLCVVGLSKNLKLITTLDRDITQNPCYVSFFTNQ